MMPPFQKEDMTTVPAIVGLLEANRQSLKALVTHTGHIYLVESACHPRALRELVREVGEVFGEVTQSAITPMEFDKWEHQRIDEQRHPATQQAVESNNTIDYIFSNAIERWASDVYFLIKRDETRLEYKSYGVKFQVDTFSRDRGWALANILWSSVSGQYDKSLPCDISLNHRHDGRLYRIRANSVPTSEGGNTIACRIRDPKQVLSLASLGYSEQQVRHIRDICMAPGGLVLFTGPTNSGKSTSVTSMMADTPRSEHMIEVADPVEVELDHCTHMEIDRYHHDHEEIFSRTLASLVRQNPDVLVLGEIRDGQTAEAAVNMAIQGKRVLSTLHSTTAASVFTRLSGLGVPDHVLALPEFMAGVVSQSLVPVPCADCSLDYKAALAVYSDWQMSHIAATVETHGLRFAHPDGCDRCLNGITGQTLVAEVFPLIKDSGPVFEMINEKKFYALPAYMAEHHGVIGKRQHARIKVQEGRIDPIATLRIVGSLGAAMEPAPRDPGLRFMTPEEPDPVRENGGRIPR